MALNGSGPISLGGSTSGQSIALELGLSATGQISLNQSSVRTLAGVASGAIVMPTDFWGKSNAGPVSGYGGQVEGYNLGSGTASASVTFNTNGTVSASASGNSLVINTVDGDQWYSPTTTGIGSSYWWRYTVVSGSAPVGGLTAGTWYQLSSSRSLSFSVSSQASLGGTFTIDIAASSGGTVLATGEITMVATLEF